MASGWRDDQAVILRRQQYRLANSSPGSARSRFGRMVPAKLPIRLMQARTPDPITE